MKSTENSSPRYHFRPEYGWMNDPNGLCFFGGQYHLFYQHNPDRNVWENIHWGHAVSTDLMTWRHCAPALKPDASGLCFSGTAAVEPLDRGGKKEPVMVLAFTRADLERERRTGLGGQTQELAFSSDGKSFELYHKRPVLEEPELRGFRDPKIWYQQREACWYMLLAADSCLRIYRSLTLENWELASVLDDSFASPKGVWECPDMFRFETPEGVRYTLTVCDSGNEHTGCYSGYCVGTFEGGVFTPDENSGVTPVDFGPDYYAAQTFANTGHTVIQAAWMTSFFYSNTIPTGPDYRGMLSLPRRLELKKRKGKWRLESRPAPEAEALLNVENTVHIRTDQSRKASIKAGPGRLVLHARNKRGKAGARTHTGPDCFTEIGWDADTGSVYLDRTHASPRALAEAFAPKGTYAKRYCMSAESGDGVEIWMDTTSLEVFCGGKVLSALVFPQEASQTVTFFTEEGTLEAEYTELISPKLSEYTQV